MSESIIARLTEALEGRYTVERELGEGGMATVYLAHDVKHNRPVALKVLKPELAAVVGAERFLAEIETTANLHHPHILPLHDSGEADGFLFYVMPYVEGETLRDRLDRERQLPVGEAVAIATSLAGALNHAHERGVIHRDIKPANVLMQDGQPLMADFGIALAVGTAGGTRLTETGLSVGTPYYMSPEQATGDQVIGPGSDIYALACVLYEMLVGEPPYPGATAQAVLGKIIAGKPVSARAQRPQVPPNVDAAIRKALEKLPADRFASAEAFARALGDPAFRHGEALGAGAATGGRWRAVALVAVPAAVLFAGFAGWSGMRTVPAGPVSRYAIQLPEGHDPGQPFGVNVAVSPDGARMVYVGPGSGGEGQQLWLRRRDQLEPTPVPGTEGARSPAFSPDGSRVAFMVVGEAVKVVSLGGEPPITVTDQGVGGGSVAWGPDGFLYFDGSSPQVLMRVPHTGGEPTAFTAQDTTASPAELVHAWPHALPSGKGVLFTVVYAPSSDLSQYEIAVADVETGEHRVLLRGVFARYSPTGHLLYATADGALLARPFDERSLEVSGDPVALTQGIGIGPFGSVDLDLADDGTLTYVSGVAASGLSRAVWIDRDGTVTPVDPEWEFDPGQPEVGVELSPDDSRLAVMQNTEAGSDIWIKELDRGPLSRLTFHDAVDRRPRWNGTGDSILFNSQRDADDGFNLWIQPADGTGAARLLLDLEEPILEVQRSPDGEWFILRLAGISGVTGIRDLVGLRRGDSVPVPLAAEPYDEKGVALSPSGRWMAYESNETGQDEIYVRPFPDVNGGKWLVSTGGGINPRWAHDEEELFYVNGARQMVAASVQGDGETFRVGERRPLFSLDAHGVWAGANYAGWDVSSDDQRFLMVQLVNPADEDRRLIVVENFLTELRERLRR